MGESTDTVATDIVIVGGGFGGCYALYTLREAGYKVKLLEAGSDFGGVWHFNKYPGARVDSESPMYQLSLPKAWRKFNFTERFPSADELRAYFAHISEAMDLRKDAVFNTRVIKATCDPETAHWTLETSTGVSLSAQYAVFATGSSNKPYFPKFPGLSQFSGQLIHPCQWPSDLDVRGKKVGIIGQGASGLQILQELAKVEDADITVFIRDPPTPVPVMQRTIPHGEAEQNKNQYGALFHWAKTIDRAGWAYNECHRSYREDTPEQRLQFWNDLWARGSYTFFNSNYPEVSYDKEANALAYQFWAERARARITDPVKREIMAPLKQPIWIGTKRPNLETDYFEMIDRPSVKLVSLKKSAIKTFTKDGIVTTASPTGDKEAADVSHDLDIVVMATGYDAVTGSLYDMNIVGTDGVKLQDRWSSSISTYLGMLVPKMPNMFILYGPQAPTGLANGPPFLEMQVDWIVQFLAKLRTGSSQSIFEVRKDACEAYVQQNLDVYNYSLFKDSPSWWNGANIPGKTVQPLFWILGLQAWRRETEEALAHIWTRFETR